MFENIQNGLTHPLFIGVIIVGLIIYSSYGPDNNSDLDSLNSSQTQESGSDLNSLDIQLIDVSSHNINSSPSYLESIYNFYNGLPQDFFLYVFVQLTACGGIIYVYSKILYFSYKVIYDYPWESIRNFWSKYKFK